MGLLTKSSQAFREATYWLLFRTVTTLNYQVNQASLGHEIKIISDRKVPKSFQSYLSNETNMVNYVFQQWKKILLEKIQFYCDHEEADTKMFTKINFLSNTVQLKRVIIDSPETDVAVTSLYYYVTNPALLDSI